MTFVLWGGKYYRRTSCTADYSVNVLDKVFGDTLISCRVWAPNGPPDLNSCDFYLWSNLSVFKQSLTIMKHLLLLRSVNCKYCKSFKRDLKQKGDILNIYSDGKFWTIHLLKKCISVFIVQGRPTTSLRLHLLERWQLRLCLASGFIYDKDR